MTRWESRVRESLEDGESITDTLEIGSSYVLLTSERLLVLSSTWENDLNIRSAPLSNVTGVRPGSKGGRLYLIGAAVLGLLGGASILGSMAIDMDSVVASPDELDLSGAEQIGGGGMIEFLETVIWLVAHLDNALEVLGILLVILACSIVAMYFLFERTPTVDVLVAGEEEAISIPVTEDPDDEIRELQRLLGPRTNAPRAWNSDAYPADGDGVDDSDGFESDPD